MGAASPAWPPPESSRRAALVLAAVLAVAIVAWAAVSLVIDRAGLAVIVPGELRGAEEASSALTRLFGALVLSLYPADDVGRRLHWIAAGLAVLGVGHLNFGYLEPLLPGETTPLNEAMYEGLLVRTLAAGLFVVGIVPARPPRLSWRGAVTVLLLPVVVYAAIFDAFELWKVLPTLATVESLEVGGEWLGRLTAWHWALSALPIGLAGVATARAFYRSRRGELGGWLLLAMVLLAGSQLHNALWPSPYTSPVLTSADLLRLSFAAVVAVGGILELRRISSERAVLLASEKERSRRLEELQAMRADLTSMVVHELGAPVSAIRSLSSVLAKDTLDPASRVRAAGAIQSEAEALRTLIADVEASAAAERGDFTVDPRPVSLEAILGDAATFAETLPGGHPVRVEKAAGERTVLADRERIGQVLRNLLSNAAKYSPEGAPVELRALLAEGRVRIEVSDEGPGIHPDEVSRIFEKFGRGRDQEGRKVPGVGLGLYLSRRIVQAHGSELTVDSAPGEGSVFGFDLEVAG